MDDNRQIANFFIELNCFKIRIKYIKKTDKMKSELEKLFFMFFNESNAELKRAGKLTHNLRPQYPCGKYKIDFAIIKKSNKVAIELDGYKFHDKGKDRFQYERERQNFIVNKGFKILRYTWDDITKNFFSCMLEINRVCNS